ncbi:MAG: DUF4876 domain-containing protein [Bacteroidales bacterium]|nr:DUF4876 domain-containing protein [Bacteroidales bacterium]
MKKSILLLIFAASVSVSCWRDSVPVSQFVSDFELQLVFGEYGKSESFPEPMSVSMTNTTEQYTYSFTSLADGRVPVSGIMPGHYTVTVSGNLDGNSLAGFVSSMVLTIGEEYGRQEITLFAVASNPVIFKELYYAGSPTPTSGTYRNDNFFSIYNNSDSPVDISDLYIGMNENYGGLGEAGPMWPGEVSGAYRNVYLRSVWKIVAGKGKYVMQPGQTVVIATMAAPHNKDSQYNPASPVDLSGADFEAYIQDPENKYPDMPAPNMELAFWPDYSYLWRSGVFGQGMVLVQASAEEFAAFERAILPETFQDPFESEEYWECLKVPYSNVVDAVDLIQNGMATVTKRFSPELDAGYATVGKTYCGHSVRRKRIPSSGKEILQDTNNSTEDFEVNTKPLAE